MLLLRIISSIFSTIALLSTISFSGEIEQPNIRANPEYPVQQFLIGIYSSNLSVVASGASLKSGSSTGRSSSKWTLNYISEGVFEIVNSENGNLLTSNNNKVNLSKSIDEFSQHWKIEGVQKDFDGYYLYYKISVNSDPTNSLTFDPYSNTFSLTLYTGSIYQKYKINLYGIAGFAGNSMCQEGEKAGAIGGLFGETVFATTDVELRDYLKEIRPLTIVVNGHLTMDTHKHTRIRDYKTIVGSFSSSSISDCNLRTNNEYGIEGDDPSDNIVIRNIDFRSVNSRGRILINIWSSRQIWIDHCSFTCSLEYDRNGNGQDEVGKFIWINTPYENYMDKKDRLRSPDYVTISYCVFARRYWTVAYGTQNDEIKRCRTTLCYNKWEKNVRRCPQIGNGNGHIFCNFFEGYEEGNGGGTAQIIAGSGSNIVSENCRFQSFENVYPRSICAGGGPEPYRDSGSFFARKSTEEPIEVSVTPKMNGSWFPNVSNYGYVLVDAYNRNGTDTKDFCNKFAGCKKSAAEIKYIDDNDLESYRAVSYQSPFLKSNLILDDTALKDDIKNKKKTIAIAVSCTIIAVAIIIIVAVYVVAKKKKNSNNSDNFRAVMI